MSTFNKLIIDEIKSVVQNADTVTKYRTPLAGFSDALNPFFLKLKQIVGPTHLLPVDLLPEAKSVVSFFIPFEEELIIKNSCEGYSHKNWAVAYIETNKLINRIIERVKEKLMENGIMCSDNPAKLGFDHDRLMSDWSQRHIAYICGLGTFGINNMLITEAGCGGRYGSFVIDREVDYSRIIEKEYCLYKLNGSCSVCMDSCPVGALTENGFDRHKCYERCLENDRLYDDLEKCEVCGKCLTGPCAVVSPVLIK